MVVEVFQERRGRGALAGNIYRGRVRKILPGMQSAFVDIGLEKDAFLYVADVADGSARLRRELSTEDDVAGAAPPPVPIEQRLQEGQEVVVQVAKEPMAGKGARVTTHVSLPGRYLVYLPTVEHAGVSRRISDEDTRARLREVAERLRESGPGGFIVRTAGEACTEDDLATDLLELRERWTEMRSRADRSPAPRLVHSELGLLDRLLRDLVTGDFGEVIVDDESDYQRCVEFLANVHVPISAQVRLHVRPGTLFEAYGVDAAIEKGLRSKIWLKSGGYLVFNQTEALVAVDVNTGRYVGKVCLEDTALATNVEAVAEIVRQVRLRDLGGIIVVDFIDMVETANREKLLTVLEAELRRDRARTRHLPMSDFGLVQITRKRVKGSLERTMNQPCDLCNGSGRRKSVETLCLEIHRQLLREGARLPDGAAIEVRAHATVARALEREYREMVDDVERTLQRRVVVTADDGCHPERYELAGS